MTGEGKRWLINIGYYLAWIMVSVAVWQLLQLFFRLTIPISIYISLAILPLLLFSGFKDELIERDPATRQELPDDVFALEPADFTATPGQLRWNPRRELIPGRSCCLSYVRNQQLVLYNPGLYDLAGFLTNAGFSRCIEVSLRPALSGGQISRPLRDCVRRLARWAQQEDETVLAGSIFRLESDRAVILLYCRPGRSRTAVRTACRIARRCGLAPAWRDTFDPEWNRFSHDLLPDEKAAQTLYNLRRSTAWKCRSVDIEALHSVFFLIEFGKALPAEISQPEGVDCLRRDEAGLIWKTETRLDPESLEQTTGRICELARRNGGRLAGYELDLAFFTGNSAG